jgi:tetratricopeptide (TPR) repeat protein
MKRQVLCCCLLALLPARALAQTAQELERAKASFKAGATAYAAGEYLAAIQALDAAYALTPVAAIAFSLAQAERRQYFASHERVYLDRAITLFRRYVDQVPTGGRRADALEALSQLEPLAAVSAGATSRAAPDGDTNRRTRLMITSEAPGARLSLDGGPPAPSPLIREVPPGQHKVEVSADGFFPDQRQVTAIQGELIPEAVSLRERPSKLTLSIPSSAEVFIDGSFATRGGDHLSMELPSGTHRMAIAEPGHRVLLRTLELERGQSQDLQVTLERTPQRKAAVVLLLSGAAAFGTGVVLGALAIHAEDRAQDFLTKQAQGNVSSGDLSSYESSVTERNRYRVATGISLAASAGLFITSLFLYELDHPSAEQTSRLARSPSSFGVAALALPGGGGTVLHGAF